MEEPSKTKLPSPQERLELILLALARKVPVKELCQQAGVSRELFYRWLREVRGAGLKALEAKAPGPKEKLAEEPREQVRQLKERIAELEGRERKLHKERDQLERVVETAQRIIRRNAWEPLEKESKKKAMRPPRRENTACESGQTSMPPEPGSRTSPDVGGSIEPHSGDGGKDKSVPRGEL
jgi:transposase-like protein